MAAKKIIHKWGFSMATFEYRTFAAVDFELFPYHAHITRYHKYVSTTFVNYIQRRPHDVIRNDGWDLVRAAVPKCNLDISAAASMGIGHDIHVEKTPVGID